MFCECFLYIFYNYITLREQIFNLNKNPQEAKNFLLVFSTSKQIDYVQKGLIPLVKEL